MYTLLRNSRFVGHRLLATSAAVAAALGASNWFLQLFSRRFQAGLGHTQTQLPIGILDLLGLAPTSSLVTGFGLLLTLFSVACLQRQIERNNVDVVILALPYVGALTFLLMVPVFVAVEHAGA